MRTDAEDRYNDSRFMAGVFSDGTAGAAGVSPAIREAKKREAQRLKTQREEANVCKIERWTRQYVEDRRNWHEATKDVVPLHRK